METIGYDYEFTVDALNLKYLEIIDWESLVHIESVIVSLSNLIFASIDAAYILNCRTSLRLVHESVQFEGSSKNKSIGLDIRLEF